MIRSTHRFTYEEAQATIDGAAPESVGQDLQEQIILLNQARQILLNRRLRQGSLQLDIEEMKLVLDDEGEVIDVISREQLAAHGLVEECMLAANEAVATFTSRHELPILRRIHSPPDEAGAWTSLSSFVGFGSRGDRQLRGRLATNDGSGGRFGRRSSGVFRIVEKSEQG